MTRSSPIATRRSPAIAPAFNHVWTIDAKKRLRHETRTLDLFRPGDLLAGTEWADHVVLVLRVDRETLKRDPSTGLWSATRETSYHVANAVIDAMTAAAAIRALGH